MNVLFSCNSKNVVKKYKDERDTYVEPEWGRSDTTRSAMEKSLNIKPRKSVRAKSVGMKLLSEMAITPKSAKVDVASNDGGSVSSNPTQEPDGNAPNGKGGAIVKLLSLPLAKGPATAGMSRRDSIPSNMALVSSNGKSGAGKGSDKNKDIK